MMNLNSLRTTLKYVCCWPILPLALSFSMTGCTKPIPVDFGQVCTAENDNKYISVEGYLRTGASVLCSSHDGTRACGLELTDKPDGGSTINAYVEEGTGNSQMEPLPKGYSDDNLKIRTQDGSLVAPRERVRIMGIAKTATGIINSATNTVCFIDVDSIEKP
jgi:hypothetical protein